MTDTSKTMNDLYFGHCRYEKNLSPLTLKAYHHDLTQFFFFLGDKVELSQVSKIDIRNYLHHLFEIPLKGSSVRRKMICVKSFFSFLESEDQIKMSPFLKLKISIKIPKKIPEVMNLTDIKLLLSIPKKELEEKNNCAFSEINFSERQDRKDTRVLQNVIILELLFATGMRVFELSNLHTDDVDLARRIVRINGKGSRQRIVPIPNDEIVALLNSYMGIERRQMENQRWLLTNRLNRRMKTQSIRTVVRKYVDKAQLKRRITPHTFRHTTATMLIENGTDIRFVQSLLGHNSIVTTQLYIHVAEATQRRIITLNHPRNLF